MAAVAAPVAPSYMLDKKDSVPVEHSVEHYLKLAQKQRELGRLREARESFRTVWRRCGADGKANDLWMRAAAGLGYADVILEEGSWLSLEGLSVDEVLEQSLDAARKVAEQPKQQRSRALEGQLLLMRSQALFSKPGKNAAELDAAMEARFAAVDILQEAAVEGLPWSRQQLQDAFWASESNTLERYDAPIGLEALLGQILELWPGSISVADETAVGHIAFLFENWASPDGMTGEKSISAKEFARQFLDIAKRFDRRVDAEPCSHHNQAPCTGNLPEDGNYSAMERQLVVLVSRDGAGDWLRKAEQMREKGMSDVTASLLEDAWERLMPVLKKSISEDAKMACGHSCSTCPTRETCQVHDAVKDIEDL
mmetsp:Transcript_51887/g.82533  ORF Transcript_51887/g.82533 Transcript_51887/m.82533 type:complete len:368 (+) Transcript_51887:46-1149(+)|eukprot:CAMPEP_0169270980 /NCGR_PEP_ID=MMETSP1016-20121227/49461_1 /TAXON_ID=342587 /ORGANISM="Karlodinium micrum, Strain CCMP2283" /LENGTH=367 /DNA_ID=CAMNT_0009356471 /DNA_START=44 /DNA_END=1147 /DNA_ORIENTATION=+